MTKEEKKVISIFENIVGNAGFYKKENFPWYIKENDASEEVIVFTFNKNKALNINLASRLKKVEDIWSKYYFELYPRQKNLPFTTSTTIKDVKKYILEFKKIEEIKIDFDGANFENECFNQFPKLLEDCILPYFNKVKNVKEIDLIINNPINTFLDSSDLFVGGNEILFKKLIIAKLSNNENYSDILIFVKNELENLLVIGYQKEYVEMRKAILKILITELENLDGTAPSKKNMEI